MAAVTDVESATDVVPPAELPSAEQAGDFGVWLLPTDDSRSTVEVNGKFLGVASSRRPNHDGHPAGRPQPPGMRCSACRWFEPRIFLLNSGGYLVHFAGRSSVPGEVVRGRHEYVRTAHEVVEQLTTRRMDSSPPRLTPPAARVLAMSAGHDDELEFSYVNRATA